MRTIIEGIFTWLTAEEQQDVQLHDVRQQITSARVTVRLMERDGFLAKLKKPALEIDLSDYPNDNNNHLLTRAKSYIKDRIEPDFFLLSAEYRFNKLNIATGLLAWLREGTKDLDTIKTLYAAAVQCENALSDYPAGSLGNLITDCRCSVDPAFATEHQIYLESMAVCYI